MRTRIKEYPTKGELKKYFRYDFKTGKLFWKIGGRKGQETGTRTVILNNKAYSVARIIYLLFNGYNNDSRLNKFTEINHKNGNKTDNRPENLREVDYMNSVHFSKQPESKEPKINGIVWDPVYKRWRSYLNIENENIYLGSFENRSFAILEKKKVEKEIKNFLHKRKS